jgi:hypothetical protein
LRFPKFLKFSKSIPLSKKGENYVPYVPMCLKKNRLNVIDGAKVGKPTTIKNKEFRKDKPFATLKLRFDLGNSLENVLLRRNVQANLFTCLILGDLGRFHNQF